MTLEQLRIFVAVATREHVTEAAKALNLTQSAVSAAIRALESQHDVPLFDRVGRRVVLTVAGRLFLTEARQVLASAAAASAALEDLAGLKRGRVQLAASQTVAHYWLPPRLVAFRAAYPGIPVAVKMGNSEQVRAWVRDGVVDCGLIEDEGVATDLTRLAVAEDELIVVCAPAVQPRGRGMAERLKSLPWVFREPGSGTRAIFETALAGLGVAVTDLTLTLELPSNEAVLSAVLAGGGAAALSRLVAGPLVKDGRLRQLQMAGPKRHFCLIRSPARSISRAEGALHQLLLTMRKR